MSQSSSITEDNVVADGTGKRDPNQRTESNVVERTEPNAIKPVCHYPLEPAMFFVFFAFSISGTVQQSQIIYQTCTAQFGYNVSDCMQLGKSNATSDTEVSWIKCEKQNILVRNAIVRIVQNRLSS